MLRPALKRNSTLAGVSTALALFAVLAPGAIAQGPAVDEYELDIPAATDSSQHGNGQGGGGGEGRSGATRSDATADTPPRVPAPTVESVTPPPSTPDQSPASGPGLSRHLRTEQKLERYQPSTAPGLDSAATSGERPGRLVPALPADVTDQFPVLLLLGGLAAVSALAVLAVRRRSFS